MKKFVALLSVCLCFVLMLIPSSMLLFNTSADYDADFQENRELAAWPTEGDLAERISGIEAYLNDHMGFRSQMIEATLRLNLMLGESPNSAVLIGTDGWLYYDDGDSSYDIMRRITLDEVDLQMIAESQTQIMEEAAKQGTAYRIFIAPDKHTVYPEYLPMKCRTGEGPSRLDQIYAYLQAHTQLPVIDVRPALLAAKDQGDLLYYKTDTHWNSYGAFIAYQELMKDLKPLYPQLHVITKEDLTVQETVNYPGDIAGMAGAAGFYEDPYAPQILSQTHSVRAESMDLTNIAAYVNPALPDAPTMLLLHDSFGPELISYLKESVSTLFVSTSEVLTYDMLVGAAPDIIVAERVERDALWLLSGIAYDEYY